jgi:polyisoprenoid-binding protein YceI
MKPSFKSPYLVITLLIVSMGYIVSCYHDDEILLSNAANIQRGTDVIKVADGWSYDKAHSNVMWETAYIGSGALLTGRFNQFGMTTFEFDEANPAKTKFEGWVYLNAVNTGEPGRDGNCLLSTFGTAAGKTTESENVARIVSRSVSLNTTDKGYIVKCDLTFHGVTKEVTAKLNYAGKTDFPAGVAGAAALSLAGFSLELQIFAKTDFGIVSNNIGDKVTIKCNAEFKKS